MRRKKLKPHGRYFPPIHGYDIRRCSRVRNDGGETLCTIRVADYASRPSAYVKAYRIRETLAESTFGDDYIVIRKLYE
jgi:hypothetical protein